MLKSKALTPKKVVLISLLCVFLSSILSAVMYPSMYYRLLIDEKYDRITTKRDTEEQAWSDWYYNGVKYSVAPGLDFWRNVNSNECTEENGFSLISWAWYVPFLKKIKMFGDNVDNPHYIYCPYYGDRNCVRINENFDYMNEEYIIFSQEYLEYERIRTDTEFSFKLKDAYYYNQHMEIKKNDENCVNFYSHSKSFDKLEFDGSVYFRNDEYYIILSDGKSENAYKAKPEFIELLRKSGILNSDS